MTLKDIFIKARKSKNLTQQQFASLLGLTTNTIGSIETGKTTRIKSATLSALASFLRVNELILIKNINGDLNYSWDELLSTASQGDSTLQEIFITARKSKGLTQQQFATRLGLTISTISLIENGKTNCITKSTLTALAKFLDISELMLLKSIKGEKNVDWSDILYTTDNNETQSNKSFSSANLTRFVEFVESSNDLYNLTCENIDGVPYFFTFNKRDHRRIILLLSFDELRNNGCKDILSENEILGRILTYGSVIKQNFSFSSIWVLFDANNSIELDYFHKFAPNTKTTLSAVHIVYILHDYTNGTTIDRVKIS